MNVPAIITALGGRYQTQKLLNVGSSAISNYIARGQFPEQKKCTIFEILEKKGYTVHPQNLEILAVPNEKAYSTLNTPTRILLVISGGIAAYKALEIARQLIKRGANVTTIMTKSAKEFITPLSVSALTGEKCYHELFSLTDEEEMGHIKLARSADLVLVAPATGNFMAKAAAGIADDLATTVLITTNAPTVMAPAMNPAMWKHASTQTNCAVLRERGVYMIGPTEGSTACGEEGLGRLSEPTEIANSVMRLAMPKSGPLRNKHAIVTSGPTYESIDPVRFIGNHSSGKQGHAIARALSERGVKVTLISGPVNEETPKNVTFFPVNTAIEMLNACEAALPADIAICAAAVGDWRLQKQHESKLKKPSNPSEGMSLQLVQNPDILAKLSKNRDRPKIVVGFSAETSDIEKNASKKLQTKKCDWIVANRVGQRNRPTFGSNLNKVTVITKNKVEKWPLLEKSEVAELIVDKIEKVFSK